MRTTLKLLVALPFLLVCIPVSMPTASASASATYYVAPPNSGGSDSNDCLTQSTACATLLRATELASQYDQTLSDDQVGDVAVYIEPGVYNSAWGDNCTGSSCSSGCNSTLAACTSMQMIEASGTEDYPITIEEDPANQGDIIFDRPQSANGSTQATPLVTLYDSSWVNVFDLNIEGVQASGCLSGTCGGTGCSGTCALPSTSAGELDVTYDSADLPTPGTDSGISLDQVSVSDTNYSCVMVNYAQYVDIEDSNFVNCGVRQDTTDYAGVYLAAGDETVEDNVVQYASGYGIYSHTGSDHDYAAVDQTFDQNQVSGSGNIGIHSGGAGDGTTTVTGNDVHNNSGAGIEVDHDVTVSRNSIYLNGGAGLLLDWITTTTCSCENIIENNTFYQNSTSEIATAPATDPRVYVAYNVFSMSNDHVWSGNSPTSCASYSSAADYNDYWNEPSSTSGFPYGAHSLYVDPTFDWNASGTGPTPASAGDLTIANVSITGESPQWGAQNADPNGGGSGGGATGGEADTPDSAADANQIQAQDNTTAALLQLDPTGYNEDPAVEPADTSQVNSNPSQFPADPVPASNGWNQLSSTNDSIEEPNISNGVIPGTGVNPNTYPIHCTRHYCHPNKHDPHTSTGPGGFYADLCGPAATTYMVRGWTFPVRDTVGNYHDKTWGSYWQGYVWKEAYEEVTWDASTAGKGYGWDSHWSRIRKQLNNAMKRAGLHHRFEVATIKPGRHALDLAHFLIYLHEDIHPGKVWSPDHKKQRTKELGPVFTSVDTWGLGQWTSDAGHGYSHYVSIEGYTSGSGGDVKYFDTMNGLNHGHHTWPAKAFFTYVDGSKDPGDNGTDTYTDQAVLF